MTLDITPATPTFSAYEKEVKSLDKETYLGLLTWYQVSETQVDHAVLKASLEAHGLKDLVPRAPRDEDVFRRCAPNGHRQRVETSNAAVYVNYLIRQVSRSSGVCVKHIVAEYVDSSGEKLDFEEVHSLKFDASSGGILSAPIGVGDMTAAEIARKIVDEYHATRGKVNDDALRQIIRKVMERSRATTVRPSGGVYFVMSQYSDLVESLEGFANDMPGMSVHSLPLVDSSKQRDMLRKAYEDETVGEAERLMAEIGEILGSADDITPDRFATISAKVNTISTRNAEYSHLLEDNLSLASTRLMLLKAQMGGLLAKIKVKAAK